MSLELAKKHLSQDLVLKPHVHKHHLKEYWGGHSNFFLDLVEIITGQQLSLKAAKTIFSRFLAIYPSTPSPKQVLETDFDSLRKSGFSSSKISYLYGLANAIEAQELDLTTLQDLSDNDLYRKLTALKGFGPWSTEMFMIFSLGRPDIFSIGDLGVRTAISRLYGIDRGDRRQMLELSEKWRPYRSYACRYLWATLDNDPS